MDLLAPIKRLTQFGYDAATASSRRRRRSVDLRQEDRVLSAKERRKLVSTARDLQRNFSIAAWAIRKHLDAVSTFTFQCRTGDSGLDRQIERFMEWYSRPQNCDVSGRFSLDRVVRTAEQCATVDGDILLVKLSDGRLQPIEGPRIKTPPAGLPDGLKPEEFVQGVRVTRTGRPLQFAVCDYVPTGSGMELRSLIPARHAIHHGYFERFDQVRGISPLASALNSFQDVAEATEYALARAKISQLFALKFKRDSDNELDGHEGEEGETEELPPRKYDFGAGPQILDLEPGEDAEFLMDRTPSTEFAAFMERMIQAALRSLDIPYSFYSENFTNYSGSRGALLLYEQSAKARQAVVRRTLMQITTWRLGLAIEDGVLSLPAGMTISDLNLQWLSHSLPWIDPRREVEADIAAIEAGLKSRTEIAKSRGRDVFAVIDELGEEAAYMRSKGMDPTTAGKVLARSVGEAEDHPDSDEQPRRGGQ